MTSDLLNPEGAGGQVWHLTFALIRRIIGGVDYKGCRDLLRGVLEKAQLLPSSGSLASVAMADSVYEVVYKFYLVFL